ncbi:MAG: nucleotidyltransferase family protein, partial [Acidithiobacillus ferrivorans]
LLTEAWVFGSRATSRARRFSDLDLLIRADAPLSFGTLAELEPVLSILSSPGLTRSSLQTTIATWGTRRLNSSKPRHSESGGRSSRMNAPEA